jgi:HAD superfamily hydrolase (TIGR01549 family)
MQASPMPDRPQVVIFDMDGTLTRPWLNFDRIREETGVDGPLLEALPAMTPAQRARVLAVLERHEAEAAANSELQPGAGEVVNAIRDSGLPTVLMTRNSRRSVETLMERHDLSFDIVRTREDGAVKPSPEPIFAVCRLLDVEPRGAWSIGDFHYDIICGAAAGAVTVLLLDETVERPTWADEADHVIHRLDALLPLLGLDGRLPGRPA